MEVWFQPPRVQIIQIPVIYLFKIKGAIYNRYKDVRKNVVVQPIKRGCLFQLAEGESQMKEKRS